MRKALLSATSLVFLLLMSSQTHAISIAPIPVELKQNQRAASLILEPTNDLEQGKVFEAKVVKWNPRDNSYTETNDVIVYPKTAKLPATFKLALKKRDFALEQTFRIIVKEIVSEQTEGISFTMTYDVPVFVRPSKISENVKVECLKDAINIFNTGNVTIKLTEIDDQGVVLYIAPGDTKVINGKKIKIKDKEYCASEKEVSL